MAGKSVLFAKFAKIIGEISRVPKRGRNEFHKYDYVTEADLLDAVRSKLAENGIAYFFSVISTAVRPTDAKGGPVTEVTVAATFADSDTGESFTVQGAGAGQDAGDKGVYKAITGAQKYVLMKTFMVPTGDDPELDEQPAAKQSTRVASGGKSAGKAKPADEAQPQPVAMTAAGNVTVEGGDAEIPSGKLKGRTVNSLTLDEAEDLLGKLPAGNRWHMLVGNRVKAMKAVAKDPSLAAVNESLDLVATK